MEQDIFDKLPYTFIELPKIICTPEWGNRISQDIPFSNGLTGKIEYTLKNKTPICVGDKVDNSSKPSKLRPCSYNGKYIIPGSSVKGMIGNVLSIATCGKFKQYERKKLSHRQEINNNDNNKDIKPIFLRFKDGKWEYKKCNSVAITDKAKILKDCLKISYLKEDDPAIDKYKSIEYCKDENGKLKANVFPLYAVLSKNGKFIIRLCKDQDSKNPNLVKGYLSFVNARVSNKNHDKPWAYFFYDKGNSPFVSIENDIDNFDKHNDNIIKRFRLSHSSQPEQLEFLELLSNEECGAPVWLYKNKIGNEYRYDIGSCKVSRTCYRYSITDLVPNNEWHDNDKVYDFRECMFGTIRESKQDGFSLKGRVSFSDLKGPNIEDVKLLSKNVLLQEPKPTFLGYLKPRNKKLYDDYNCAIAGRKIYKIINFKNIKDSLLNDNCSSTNLSVRTNVSFVPTDKEFKGCINFNNLNPIELGALLWCLVLGKGKESEEVHFHNLGHAKPYGAGVNIIKIDNIKYNEFTKQSQNKSDNINLAEEIDDYINAFEGYIKNYFSGWASYIERFLQKKEIDKNRTSLCSAYPSLEDYTATTKKNKNSKVILSDRSKIVYQKPKYLCDSEVDTKFIENLFKRIEKEEVITDENLILIKDIAKTIIDGFCTNGMVDQKIKSSSVINSRKSFIDLVNKLLENTPLANRDKIIKELKDFCKNIKFDNVTDSKKKKFKSALDFMLYSKDNGHELYNKFLQTY